jgi:predicted AAA+ superfamily ATPase
MYIRTTFLTLLHRIKEPRRWIQVLIGPRQVGKTTGVLQILETLKQENVSVIYGSGDEPYLKDRDWLVQQWNHARLACAQKKPHPYAVLVIDEVQKIQDWSEIVKSLWDEDSRNRIPLKVILLGSSTLLLQRGLSESLSGRFELTRLTHWSFTEMSQNFGLSLEQWIYFGGYPGPAELIRDEPRWSSFIRDSLIETTLSRDILLIHTVEKPALLRKLFHLGCHYSSQILSFHKILGQLHEAGNASTLAHYLSLLSEAGLLMGIEKFTGSEVHKKSSSPKFQVLNTALLSAQQSQSFGQIQADPQLWGRWVESAVGTHILNSAVLENIRVFYWRDRMYEVDFVLQGKNKLLAIEVKSSKKKESRSGLELFRRRYNPDHCWIIGGNDGLPLEKFLRTSLTTWLS